MVLMVEFILGGPNDDQVVAIVIDNPGENYPAKDNPDDDVLGLVDVVVTIGGTGYTTTDPIVIPGISTTGTVLIPNPNVPTVIPIDGGDPIPPSPPETPPDTPGFSYLRLALERHHLSLKLKSVKVER